MAAKKTKNTPSELKEAFVKYAIKYRQLPESDLDFCEESKIKEENFYQHFQSIEELHSQIWSDFITDTIQVLNEDPEFEQFSVREQLLAFYYTHLEVIKSKRDFIQICDDVSNPLPLPEYLKGYKHEFGLFSEALVEAGIQTGEVADRKIINKLYDNGLWLQLIFVIKFWIKDKSKDFEQTDAAIEKAVTTSAEIVRPGPINSIIDFAKFIYRTRK